MIGDVLKTDVYQIARWINREKALIPPDVLTKAPSAELKPHQTDQDSLPPYDVLDAILRHYVEEEKSADEIAALGFDAGTVERTVSADGCRSRKDTGRRLPGEKSDD